METLPTQRFPRFRKIEKPETPFGNHHVMMMSHTEPVIRLKIMARLQLQHLSLSDIKIFNQYKRSKTKTTKIKINILPRLKCFLFVYGLFEMRFEKKSDNLLECRESKGCKISSISNIFLKLLKRFSC